MTGVLVNQEFLICDSRRFENSENCYFRAAKASQIGTIKMSTRTGGLCRDSKQFTGP